MSLMVDSKRTMKRRSLTVACGAILSSLLLFVGETRAAEPLTVLPAAVPLDGPEAWQTLLVQETSGERVLGQVTENVAFQSSDEKVVKVENGVAVPTGDGRAVITAKVGDRTATTEVTV